MLIYAVRGNVSHVLKKASLPGSVTEAYATTPKFSFSVPHCAHDAMMHPHFGVVERPRACA